MSGVGWYLVPVDTFGSSTGVLVCAAEGCSWTHAVGMEPSVARLVASADQFTELDADRLEDLLEPEGFADDDQVQFPGIADELANDEPVADPGPLDRIPARAHLFVRQVDADGRTFEWSARDLFLVEWRVVGGERAGEEPKVIELLYANVARFWDTHGEVTRGWNVRRRGLTLALGAQRQPDLALHRRFFDGATLKADGEFHSLRDVVQDLLNALPGRPRLVEFPRGQEPDLPVEVSAQAANPKAALRELFDAFGFIPMLYRDRTFGVYLPGAGTTGERPDDRGGDNTRPHDFEFGVGTFEGDVPDETNFYAKRSDLAVPEKVLVTGPLSVYDAGVDYCVPAIQVESIDGVTGERVTEFVEFTKPNLGRFGIPEDAQDDLELLMEIPFTRGQAWPADLETVPDRMRAILRRQLGRVWMLPYRHRRLAPLLERAARYPDDSRKPVTVEAFGFESKRIDVRDEVEELAKDLRTKEELQFQALDEQIARLENQIKELRYLTLNDVIDGLMRAGGELVLIGRFPKPIDFERLGGEIQEGLIQFLHGYGSVARQVEGFNAAEFPIDRVPGSGDDGTFVLGIGVGLQGPRIITEVPGGNLDALGTLIASKEQRIGQFRAVFEVRAAGVAAAEAEELTADLRRAGESMERFGLRIIGELLRIDDKPALDPQGQFVDQLREQLESAKKARLALLSKIDPVRGFQQQIDELHREIEQDERRSGIRATGKRARLADLQARKEKAIADAEDPEEKKPVFAYVHSNLPRREVGVRVLSTEYGAFEIEAPSLWLASQLVADPAETSAVLMPVRIWFGTWNAAQRDRQLAVGAQQPPRFSENEFVRVGAQALAEEPELAVFAQDTGDFLPELEGAHSARFGFTPDVLDGTAELDPSEAFLIAHPDVRYLFARDGNNAAEVRALAEDLAREATSRPVVTDGGEATVYGPRPVNPNGRISAVECTSEDGSRAMTRVSFEPPELPLPDVRRRRRAGGFFSFEFGIPERDQR